MPETIVRNTCLNNSTPSSPPFPDSKFNWCEGGGGRGGSPQLHSLAGEGSLITRKKVGRGGGDDEVRKEVGDDVRR